MSKLLCIGGSNDGHRVDVPDHASNVKMLHRDELAAPSPEQLARTLEEVKVEDYRRCSLSFTGRADVAWLVHCSLTDWEAVHQLTLHYHPGPKDLPICNICGGGPGNAGVCLCGHKAYAKP